jgi:hypothetical protein
MEAAAAAEVLAVCNQKTALEAENLDAQKGQNCESSDHQLGRYICCILEQFWWVGKKISTQLTSFSHKGHCSLH